MNEDFNAAGAYSHLPQKRERTTSVAPSADQSGFPRSTTEEIETFFFFSFESLPTTTLLTSNNLLTVPTSQYQVGNFSAALAATANKVLGQDPLGRNIVQNAIYDPSTQRPVSSTNSLVIRDPYPNNIIPPTSLDKVALRVQALIPQPQGPFASQLINNYVNPYTVKAQDYIPSFKVDHSLNSKMKLSQGLSESCTSPPPDLPTNTTEDGFPATDFHELHTDTLGYHQQSALTTTRPSNRLRSCIWARRTWAARSPCPYGGLWLQCHHRNRDCTRTIYCRRPFRFSPG